MKNDKQSNVLRRFTIALLVFILLTSTLNIHLLTDAIRSSLEEPAGLSGFIEKTETAYTSDDFKFKPLYINLNGLFAKLTGRTVYNEVATLKNGMLANSSLTAMDSQESSTAAASIADFRSFAEDLGIEYLFVQAPYKLDIQEELLPVGVENHANQRADSILSFLSEYGVNTLDLRPWICADTLSLEQYFYQTDHHWNTAGAFTAFQTICQELSTVFPDAGIETSPFLQGENWRMETYENWFLGSHGKRVGTLFAGTDDLLIYTPLLETNMSCYVVNHRRFYSGSFSDANIRAQYLDEPDYFGDNAYCVYIGGDYPLVQHRNPDAVSNLKVLLLKDSFSLPVQAFLSTVFREVDVVDSRYFTECSLAEYVECSRPDIVISMLCPQSLTTTSHYDFGTEEARALLEQSASEPIEGPADIIIEAGDREYGYEVAFSGLESNTKYTLTVASVTITDGSSAAASLALYNADTDTVITSRAIDLAYQAESGTYVWSFVTPDTNMDELQLLLYAGTAGSTAGNTATWQGISLVKH